MATTRDVARSLIRWARKHGRHAPWRQTKDAYPLAVAEVLLQKTKGEDVAPVWDAVVATCPTANALVGASDAALKALVGRLGLGNQRVQRLKAMAQALKEDAAGSIPGLGPYASAVLALAQGRKPSTIPVDGNIARVVCRYYGLSFERGEPRKKPEVKQAVTGLLATRRNAAGKLRMVYALVDLGATVCKAPSPNCEACPLSRSCAFASARRLP